MLMMCPKCGKLIEGGAVRCPDCGAEFDLQYAPPRLEPGPSQLGLVLLVAIATIIYTRFIP